jgi:nucleoporin NUP159
VGTPSGALVQYTPEGIIKATIPPPPSLEPNSQPKAIQWLENDVFQVSYALPDAALDDPLEVYIITRSKMSPQLTYTKFYDPLDTMGILGRSSHHRYHAELKNWGTRSRRLNFMISGLASTIGILHAPEGVDAPWESLILEETGRGSMPAGKKGVNDDTSCLGLALDLTSQMPIKRGMEGGVEVPDLPPAPRLLAFSQEGFLVSFNVINPEGGAFPGMIKPREFVESNSESENVVTAEISKPAGPEAFGSTLEKPAPSVSAFGGVSTSSTTPAFGFSEFGAGTKPSPFGQASTSAFGGASRDTSSPFGAPSTSTAAFGKAATSSAFGSTISTPTKSGQSAFGQSGFGQISTPYSTPAPSAFGTSSTPSAFGSAFAQGSTTPTATPAKSAFGASTTPSASAFGSSTTPSAFGQSSFGASSFGSSSTPSAFASSTKPAANPFGLSAIPTAFGSSTSAPAVKSFGNTSTPPAFGSSTSITTPNPFGNTPTPSAFGSSTPIAASNPFGAPSAPSAFTASSSASTSSGFGAFASSKPTTSSGFSFGGFGQNKGSGNAFGIKSLGGVGIGVGSSAFGQKSAFGNSSFGNTTIATGSNVPEPSPSIGSDHSYNGTERGGDAFGFGALLDEVPGSSQVIDNDTDEDEDHDEDEVENDGDGPPKDDEEEAEDYDDEQEDDEDGEIANEDEDEDDFGLSGFASALGSSTQAGSGKAVIPGLEESPPPSPTGRDSSKPPGLQDESPPNSPPSFRQPPTKPKSTSSGVIKPATAFGGTSSGFGAFGQASTSSTFGGSAKPSAFSSPSTGKSSTSPTATTAFGSASTSTPAFGTSSFGQTSTPRPAFGASAFGQPSSTTPSKSAFAASNPGIAFGSSSFGKPSGAAVSAFGQPSVPLDVAAQTKPPVISKDAISGGFGNFAKPPAPDNGKPNTNAFGTVKPSSGGFGGFAAAAGSATTAGGFAGFGSGQKKAGAGFGGFANASGDTTSIFGGKEDALTKPSIPDVSNGEGGAIDTNDDRSLSNAASVSEAAKAPKDVGNVALKSPDKVRETVEPSVLAADTIPATQTEVQKSETGPTLQSVDTSTLEDLQKARMIPLPSPSGEEPATETATTIKPIAPLESEAEAATPLPSDVATPRMIPLPPPSADEITAIVPDEADHGSRHASPSEVVRDGQVGQRQLSAGDLENASHGKTPAIDEPPVEIAPTKIPLPSPTLDEPAGDKEVPEAEFGTVDDENEEDDDDDDDDEEETEEEDDHDEDDEDGYEDHQSGARGRRRSSSIAPDMSPIAEEGSDELAEDEEDQDDYEQVDHEEQEDNDEDYDEEEELGENHDEDSTVEAKDDAEEPVPAVEDSMDKASPTSSSKRSKSPPPWFVTPNKTTPESSANTYTSESPTPATSTQPAPSLFSRLGPAPISSDGAAASSDEAKLAPPPFALKHASRKSSPLASHPPELGSTTPPASPAKSILPSTSASGFSASSIPSEQAPAQDATKALAEKSKPTVASPFNLFDSAKAVEIKLDSANTPSTSVPSFFSSSTAADKKDSVPTPPRTFNFFGTAAKVDSKADEKGKSAFGTGLGLGRPPASGLIAEVGASGGWPTKHGVASQSSTTSNAGSLEKSAGASEYLSPAHPLAPQVVQDLLNFLPPIRRPVSETSPSTSATRGTPSMASVMERMMIDMQEEIDSVSHTQ